MSGAVSLRDASLDEIASEVSRRGHQVVAIWTDILPYGEYGTISYVTCGVGTVPVLGSMLTQELARLLDATNWQRARLQSLVLEIRMENLVVADSAQTPRYFSAAARCPLLCVDSVQPSTLLGTDDPRSVNDTLAKHEAAIEVLNDTVKAHADQREATRLTEAAARNSLNIRLAKIEASEYLARDLASDLTEITDRIRQIDDQTRSDTYDLYDRIRRLEDSIRVHVDQQVSTEVNTAADRQAIAAAVASLCERLNIIHSAVMKENALDVDILKNINGRLSVIEKARGYTHKKVPPPLDDGNDIDIDDGA